MIRTFLLLLIAGTLAARASEPISAPQTGASASVSQPHVTAELIPSIYNERFLESFDVALHLHSDPGWHTYWINPGDAGLATTIKWTLPPGFTAGPIQWPTPEKHNMGPLITYGYEGDVYLLTRITVPPSIRRIDLHPHTPHLTFTAHASWLVCKEECIPGHADLTVPIDFEQQHIVSPDDTLRAHFFNEAYARLPVPNAVWDVFGFYTDKDLCLSFYRHKDAYVASTVNGYFFPEQGNVLDPKANAVEIDLLSTSSAFGTSIALQQNGEKPDTLSGVLVSDTPIIGKSNAVYISAFHVQPSPPSNATTFVPSGGPNGSPRPFLLAVLGAAFIGGLILNLMPCVLPVLALKVFSLMKHAGENPRAAWKQGAAFTAGVVISFWVLAGLLLALRAAGNQLGWGFQMQSPGFVLALIFLFFLLALNLFGVFEVGGSLVGLDAKATGKFHGLPSSFLNGALATLAATPCTAPFMGGALGFAAQQPPAVSMLIFTFLALGMASPYLLLTLFPGALRFVPKPGAWMEAFKQFMGFLLMATVIFLIYVFGALVGEERLPWLLGLLLVVSLAAWIYGRWANPMQSLAVRLTAFIVVLGFLGYALNSGIALAQQMPAQTALAEIGEGIKEWQPWSPAAVDAALAQNRPVFVDFTAAWCLSCKVNERLALDTDAVRQAFAQKNVALLKADWTHSDPAISAALRQYNRDGVPLYLLYSPKNKDAPKVLPAVLTPGIVLEALGGL